MPLKSTMEEKLRAAFSPTKLEIVDQSHMHEGHSGWREGGNSHFAVDICAAVFKGLSRIDRQRLVYTALKEELAGPVHALSLKISIPESEA